MAAPSTRLVICVDNDGYEASLERRKIYVMRRDAVAEKRGHVLVIDESGEDYLYPKCMFVEVELPAATRQAVLAHA